MLYVAAAMLVSTSSTALCAQFCPASVPPRMDAAEYPIPDAFCNVVARCTYGAWSHASTVLNNAAAGLEADRSLILHCRRPGVRAAGARHAGRAAAVPEPGDAGAGPGREADQGREVRTDPCSLLSTLPCMPLPVLCHAVHVQHLDDP